jgi:hypothetical protein
MKPASVIRPSSILAWLTEPSPSTRTAISIKPQVPVGTRGNRSQTGAPLLTLAARAVWHGEREGGFKAEKMEGALLAASRQESRHALGSRFGQHKASAKARRQQVVAI